jgi:hypothetical protein
MMTHLVESETRFLIFKTLEKCHEKKMYYYSIFINILTVVFLVAGVGFILWTRCKTRRTDEENALKIQLEQQIILSKIKEYGRSQNDPNPNERDGYSDSSYLDRLPTFNKH